MNAHPIARPRLVDGVPSAVRLLLVLTALAIPFAGCVHGIGAAYQALDHTAAGLDASAKAFEQYDHDHQLALVAADKKAGKATGDIEADLAAYRQKRTLVVKAYADAGAVVVTGRALLPLVESGLKKQADLMTWLQQLFDAARDVQTALRLIGIGG